MGLTTQTQKPGLPVKPPVRGPTEPWNGISLPNLLWHAITYFFSLSKRNTVLVCYIIPSGALAPLAASMCGLARGSVGLTKHTAFYS